MDHMYEKETGDVTVLCGASAYEEKYYLNPLFERMPEEVKKELRTICILFVEEAGGVFLMEFDQDGSLQFPTEAKDSDYQYDEIGAALMVKEIERRRRDLIEGLEMYFRIISGAETAYT